MVLIREQDTLRRPTSEVVNHQVDITTRDERGRASLTCSCGWHSAWWPTIREASTDFAEHLMAVYGAR